MSRKIVFCLLALLVFASVSFARETKVVRLSSLEWPPYSGARLDGDGVSSIIVREAFASMGYALQIEFLPWRRAVDAALHDPQTAGYFPEYVSEGVKDEFVCSDRIGSSPLGFVHRSGEFPEWRRLEDLKGFPIGVVGGYVNSEEFDDLVRRKELTVAPVNDDFTNIRKVANGRISMAVIDKNAMHFMLKYDLRLREHERDVQFHDRLLAYRGLYVCFRKGDDGSRLVRILNEGLRRINAPKMEMRLLKPYFYE